MASLITSWLFGRLLDSGADILTQRHLENQLRDVVKKWTRTLPSECGTVSPESLLQDLVGLSLSDAPRSSHRERVRSKIEQCEIPALDDWCRALREQWVAVRLVHGKDAQQFFQLRPSAVKEHLIDLADRLFKACAANSEISLPGVHKKLFDLEKLVIDVKRLSTAASSLQPDKPDADSIEFSVLGESFVNAILPHLQSHLVALSGEHDLPNRRANLTGLEPITTDPPPSNNPRCDRRTTVQEIMRVANDAKWYSIHGPPGIGKTQLALQILENHDGPKYWLRFRDTGDEQAFARLATFRDSICLDIGGHPDEHETQAPRFTLPQGSMLILDDLPYFRPDSSLFAALCDLAKDASRNDTSIISTSYHSLPTEFRGDGSALCHEFECPVFSRQEIQDLLTQCGAPNRLLSSQTIAFIESVTRGHPILVSAAVRFLDGRKWSFLESEISDLLCGKYTHAISAETTQQLINTVPHEESRGLLYRLRVVVGSFGWDEMRAVASAVPSISRLNEHVVSMTGLWLQPESDGRFVLSPLLKALPDDNLTPSECREVHSQLAECMVQRNVLGPWEFASCVSHYAQADRPQSAMILLMNGLRAVAQDDWSSSDDAGPIPLLFADSALPAGIPIDMELFVRGHQLAARCRLGLPTDFVVDEIERLEPMLGDCEKWSLIGLIAVANRALIQAHVRFAISLYARIITCWHDISYPGGEPILPPDGLALETLLWLPLSDIKDFEDIRCWMTAVRGLEQDKRSSLFRSGAAEHCIYILTDWCWLEEHKKSKDQRNWDTVLSQLGELEEFAHESCELLLGACVARAQIIIMSEYMDDLAAAVSIGQRELRRVAGHESAEFAIGTCVAYQYLLKGMRSDAREWFRQVLSIGVRDVSQRAVALIHASNACGECDPLKGVCLAEEACRIADAIFDEPCTSRVVLLGELGIARWLAGNRQGTFEAFDRAVEEILAVSERNESWQGVFMYVGHACRYFSAIAFDGTAPQESRDGGACVPPERGWFYRDPIPAAQLYSEQESNSIFLHLILFAECVGDSNAFDKWANKGTDAAHRASLSYLRDVYSAFCIVGCVENNNYEEAMRLAALNAHCSAVMMEHKDEGKSQVWDVGAPIEISEESDLETRCRAERHQASIALFPIALHVALQALKGREANAEFAKLVEGIAATDWADAAYWRTIVKVSTRAFIDPPCSRDLISLGNEYDDWLLRALCHLGATLDRDVSLEYALQGHLAVLAHADGVLGCVTGVARRIVLPFIETYWLEAFAAQRFRFRRPSVIADQLEFGLPEEPENRTRYILRTMASGLGVAIPAWAKDWLSDE